MASRGNWLSERTHLVQWQEPGTCPSWSILLGWHSPGPPNAGALSRGSLRGPPAGPGSAAAECKENSDLLVPLGFARLCLQGQRRESLAGPDSRPVPFYRRENRGSTNLSSLPTATQLRKGPEPGFRLMALLCLHPSAKLSLPVMQPGLPEAPGSDP